MTKAFIQILFAHRAIAEAAKQARIDARTDPTNEDWGDLVCAVEFAEPQEQAEWLAWYEDDSEINQATMIDYVSTEFNRLWGKLTDKARAAFDEFELLLMNLSWIL